MLRLPPHQYALIAALAQWDDSAGPPSIEALAAKSGVDQAQLTAAAVEFETAGKLRVNEEAFAEMRLTEEGNAIAAGEKDLPEETIILTLLRLGGKATIQELTANAPGSEPGKYARLISDLGWAHFDRGTFTRTDLSQPPKSAYRELLGRVRQHGGVLQIRAADIARFKASVDALRKRPELAAVKDRNSRVIELSDSGKDILTAFRRGEVAELREANELTAQMLDRSSPEYWRNSGGASFRAYDVTLAAERAVPGKAHPLSRLIEEVRGAFLSLGFSEANCPMAESAFWDFDALFQPQDHPARDMQDTFYLSQPARYELPDAKLVEAVRATHETGGATGSLGWRYTWSAERAAQVVLRTHMTASSILALSRDPHPPRKVFSIGRVFRRETVDATHLPEFTQVDGIIVDEHANLASLLGTLATFYKRMGIEHIKMKPAFFPYTEPSVEVHVNYAGRWMEMGGAGIFRPEVTEPFGCRVPVLAWGLGLERLAMARYGLTSIKELYQGSLGWLRDAPVNA